MCLLNYLLTYLLTAAENHRPLACARYTVRVTEILVPTVGIVSANVECPASPRAELVALKATNQRVEFRVEYRVIRLSTG